MSQYENSVSQIITFDALPETQKLFQTFSKNLGIESMSLISETCLKEIPKFSTNFELPKAFYVKLVSVIENIKPESRLSLYLPCLQMLNIIVHSSDLVVSNSLVNSFTGFLANIKNFENFEVTAKVITQILEVLMKICMVRRKKNSNYEGSWGPKTANAVSGIFNQIIKENEFKSIRNFWIGFGEDGKNEVDLLLYVGFSLNTLIKIGMIPSTDMLYNSLPYYFDIILEEFDQNSRESHININIAMEKTANALNLLNSISETSKRHENIRSFLKIHLEKLQKLFFHCIYNLSFNSCLSFAEVFEEDITILGRLFSSIFEISINIASNSDLEAFPLILFSNVLLKAYILQFLQKYLKIGLTEINIQELQILDLIFSPNFFMVDDSFKIGAILNITWERIFDIISVLPNSATWISNFIIDSIDTHKSNFDYLQVMQNWVYEKVNKGHLQIISLVSHDFLEKMIKNLLNFSEDSEIIIEFFIMVKSVIYTYEISKSICQQITDFLLQELIISNKTTADLALSCLSGLLRQNDLESFEKFIIVLKKCKDLPTIYKFLDCVQDTLKDSETNKLCQTSFVKAGIFETLKNILIKNHHNNESELLWPSVLECIRFLISDNQFCKAKLKEFEINVLAETLIADKNFVKKENISENCTEITMYILFENTNLTIFHEVVTPQIIPLLITMMGLYYSPFSDYLLMCLDYSYNAIHFSTNFASEKIFSLMPSIRNSEIYYFLIKVFEKIETFNITPLELKKFFRVSSLLMIKKKNKLLKSLANKIEKAFSNNEQGINSNQMVLNPTRYFWFHNKNSNLKNYSESFSFLPKKDFTIVSWVYPLSKIKSCLAEFTDKKSKFSIFTHENKVEVSYFVDKKNIFTLTTPEKLVENQWNLICVSFQQVTKFITSQYIYEVYVNNMICEYKLEGKLSNLNFSQNTLILGNSQDLKFCFNGKVLVFNIYNRFFSDFSCFFSVLDYRYLAFIPSFFSISSISSGFDFSDFNTSVYYEINPYLTNFKPEEIILSEECENIRGTDIISSFISIGGFEVFLTVLKDSEFSTCMQILKIISNLCLFNSVEVLINEDFFEILAHLLENIVIPTEKLLEIIKKILARLEWKVDLQSKVFTNLLLNSKIWANLRESIQENYLGTLSIYIPRHLSCVINDCFLLYSHISALNPLSIKFSAEVYSKILPKLIDSKNLEAINFLMLKMNEDDPELLEGFFREMSLVKFSKNCAKDAVYLLLFFLDKPNSYLFTPGILMVFKSLIEVLVKEYMSEKKTLENDEILNNIFDNLDKKLGQDLTLNNFTCIISIATLAYNYNSQIIADKFAMFIDLITSRVVLLSEECIQEFLNHSKDPKFCNLITARPTFPDWLLGCYYNDLACAVDIGISLFSLSLQKTYLYKLRMFLVTIGKKKINKALDFYCKVLDKLLKIDVFQSTPHYFLDFCAIFEDLLNLEVNRSEINSSVFICIVISMVQYSIFLNLIHCTYPPFPKIDFSLQYELFRERPIEITINQDMIYLREGGFLRMILKFIFMGLYSFPSPSLLTSLKIVLKGGVEIEKFPILMPSLHENTFTNFELERFSIAYPRLPVRNGDLLYSEEFISLYTLAEITDILNVTGDQSIIDFTLEFLQQIELDMLIVAWSKKISSKELEDLYKLVKETKGFLNCTCKSRVPYSEKNNYAELGKNLTVLNLNSWQISIQDQAGLLADAKNNEFLLRDLLVSFNWISRVHIFLIAYTSSKLNFVANMVKIPNFHIRKASAPNTLKHQLSLFEDPSKVQINPLFFKQEDLKQLQATFVQSESMKKVIIEKNFARLSKFYRRFTSPFEINKLKIRNNLDSIGRIATCWHEKGHRLMSRKKTIMSTPDPKYRPSAIPTSTTEYSIFETFIEEPEFSAFPVETEEEVLDESTPELKQTLQLDCEKIKVSSSIFGVLEISQNFLVFVSEGKEKPSSGIFFGSALKFMQDSKKHAIVCNVEDIQEVFPRRFIHKHSAFEVYLRTGKSYLLNVFTAENRNSVFEAMKSWKNVKVVVDTNGSILRSYTRKWKRGDISNLEYLLIVNKFASRSFNDLSQYPVFPWVLKDYKSEELRLDDSSIYRNFKLPIGAQTEAGREEAEIRFSMGIDEQPYHFGSHYSSGAIVLHYMLRIEPFTSLAKSLQGGSFDIPDRLFNSLEECWISGQGTSGDVKELIPEMFYLSEIFTNHNQEEFGTRQDKNLVNHVILPKWASNSHDFIRKHLMALESNYVSSQLHHWIDLIFGYKQKGKLAKLAFNIFNAMSYEENFKKIMESHENESFLQGMVDQVVHFGQTPCRVFHAAHVCRDLKSSESNIFEKYRKFNEASVNGCEVLGQICAILFNSKYLILVKHHKIKVSILKIELSGLTENHVIFQRKKEKVLANCVTSPNHSPFHYTMFGENKIISGNHLDNSVKIHSTSGKLLHSIHGHTDLVNSVFCTSSLIITASLDSSIFSWKFNTSKIKPFKIYQGHLAPISQISVLISYFLLFSIDDIGEVLIHDIRTAECLHGLKTEFTKISVSNLKFIAVYNDVYLKVIDLQGEKIWDKNFQVKFARFDSSGNNLYYCGHNSWGFYNVFEGNKKFENSEENFVSDLVLSNNQNYLVRLESKDKYSLVFTFEILNKDILTANQGINF